MSLLSGRSLRMAFGGRALLDGVDLHLHRGERIGLVGRNGEGKSTLLKVLAGEMEPDGGSLARASGLRAALLSQRVPDGVQGTVEEVVAAGLPERHRGEIHRVERLCSMLELDPGASFPTLSGGNKRRALLGRALAGEPDLLLLDEPTNHLDLESIRWLEGFLLRYSGTVLFVTHDRAFVRTLATRILELDRGRLMSWECDYETYLERKEEWLALEEKRWAEEDRKLAQEEAWIRQGIKARRTRNMGRVRALEEMRRARERRRERTGEVSLAIQEGERSGKKVIEAEGVSFGYEPGEPVVRDVTTTILRGDKVGIIGPNGAGKTTLVQLLLGRLEPDGGTVEHGASLEVAYFDQHRAQLDPGASVLDNVAPGRDFVEVGGERKHIMSYLQDFLFAPERVRQPVSSLSGGERNRLLLARLFTRPANVLVLDEPTNDLDTETLELLEAQLVGFEGTVLAVSHDREFLDNLCTSTLVFEGRGRVKEYVGGYSDWRRVVERRKAEEGADRSGPEKKGRRGRRDDRPAPGTPAAEPAPKKLSWKEKKELEALPPKIEHLEERLAELHERMGDPAFYQGPADQIKEVTEEASTLEAEIEALFTRWSELSEREG